jgi:hypothetical protein
MAVVLGLVPHLAELGVRVVVVVVMYTWAVLEQ